MWDDILKDASVQQRGGARDSDGVGVGDKMGDGHDSNDGLQYNTVLCRVYCYFYFNCLVMLLW